jgi:hypothetical protein
MDIAAQGTYDTTDVTAPAVIKESTDFYRLWYVGSSGSTIRILYAESKNGINWENKSWQKCSLDNLQNGSSIADIQAGLNSLPITDETSLDFAFDLSTTSASATPTLDNIVVNFE